jgi:hypothetical protein
MSMSFKGRLIKLGPMAADSGIPVVVESQIDETSNQRQDCTCELCRNHRIQNKNIQAIRQDEDRQDDRRIRQHT